MYAFSAFVLAEIVGAKRAAGWVRSRLVTRFKLGEGLIDEPIWWIVFEEGSRNLERTAGVKDVEVFLNVHMAGGGRYTGVLHHFTVAADTEPTRDFSIWKARYYAPDAAEPVELPAADVVVLNARDCRAIEVRYVPKKDVVVVPVPSSLGIAGNAPTATVESAKMKSADEPRGRFGPEQPM